MTIPWYEQMRCYEIFKQEKGKLIVTVPCQSNSALHVFLYWTKQVASKESSQRTTSEAGSEPASKCKSLKSKSKRRFFWSFFGYFAANRLKYIFQKLVIASILLHGGSLISSLANQ